MVAAERKPSHERPRRSLIPSDRRDAARQPVPGTGTEWAGPGGLYTEALAGWPALLALRIDGDLPEQEKDHALPLP